MTKEKQSKKKLRRKRLGKVFAVISVEIIILLILYGSYRLYINIEEGNYNAEAEEVTTQPVGGTSQPDEDMEEEDLTQAEQKARAEQERLKKEIAERQELITEADQLTLGYNYEDAIDLIKNYKGAEGGYQVYTELSAAVERLEAEKAALVLYGGSYDSITQINHIFFHTLVADNSKAFDGDSEAKGYNMYMTTISEFEKILQKMYDDGYVLVSMSDLTKKVTLEDNTTKYVPNEIYLRQGKKPFVLSEDDVSFYEYMKDDGFASRIIIGEDGKPTCEMVLDDGTITTGAFDVVPILDAFVEKHPDFSYKGAKGLLAVTGYEGILGYRTNNPNSPTYEADKEAVKKVVEVLKAEGWEFGSHSWGHKNMQKESIELLKRDTKRWMEEVEPLTGPTDIYVFPFGIDIETTVGNYKSEKYQFLKESGFNVFVGVFKEPWMQIKKDYVRMTRRPLDGQAMLEFPDRLTDLFDTRDILDPERPAKNW